VSLGTRRASLVGKVNVRRRRIGAALKDGAVSRVFINIVFITFSPRAVNIVKCP